MWAYSQNLLPIDKNRLTTRFLRIVLHANLTWWLESWNITTDNLLGDVQQTTYFLQEELAHFLLQRVSYLRLLFQAAMKRAIALNNLSVIDRCGFTISARRHAREWRL